jgi:hypothetical protein
LDRDCRRGVGRFVWGHLVRGRLGGRRRLASIRFWVRRFRIRFGIRFWIRFWGLPVFHG